MPTKTHFHKLGHDADKIYNYNNNIEIHILYTAVTCIIENWKKTVLGYFQFNYTTVHMTISIMLSCSQSL